MTDSKRKYNLKELIEEKDRISYNSSFICEDESGHKYKEGDFIHVDAQINNHYRNSSIMECARSIHCSILNIDKELNFIEKDLLEGISFIKKKKDGLKTKDFFVHNIKKRLDKQESLLYQSVFACYLEEDKLKTFIIRDNIILTAEIQYLIERIEKIKRNRFYKMFNENAIYKTDILGIRIPIDYSCIPRAHQDLFLRISFKIRGGNIKKSLKSYNRRYLFKNYLKQIKAFITNKELRRNKSKYFMFTEGVYFDFLKPLN